MDHELIDGYDEGKKDENIDEANKIVKKDEKKRKDGLLLFKPIINVSIYKHKKK